jgi:hypothetical protein
MLKYQMNTFNHGCQDCLREILKNLAMCLIFTVSKISWE